MRRDGTLAFVAAALLSCGGAQADLAETREIAIAPPPSAPRVVRTAEPRESRRAASSLPDAPPPPALSSPVQFDVGKATLKPGSDDVLRPVKDFLELHPEVTLLRIESHSDNKGSRDFNLKLTSERALSVAR